MIYVCHRINTIEELQKIPTYCGIEVDLRDRDQNIILSHDPFISGETFEEFLNHYKHRFIILNIKSEGIEFRIIQIMRERGIQDYFFLDSSIPMINKMLKMGEKNIAVRFSELEPFEMLVNFNGCKWVWVDCFTKFILTDSIINHIHDLGFKICVVSPELQGQDDKVLEYSKKSKDIDMVCSKYYNYNVWN